MYNKELSVVIPVYMEEENLRILLPRLKDALVSINDSFEVLVIDALKPIDNTKELCQKNDVVYINRIGGNNYGDAIRTGIEHASGRYAIFMDGDGSHTPEFIKSLYNNKLDCDVVVASRYTKDGNTENNKILIFMSLLVNVVYSLVLGIRCKDISNSFKLYKTEDLKNLKLTCDNFDIVEEILYKLKKQKVNLKIKEIPFLFKKRMFGNTKRNLFLFMLSYFVTLIKLRFSK